MNKVIIAAALVAGLATPAMADETPWVFGAGAHKCASWTPVVDTQVGGWVQGYWSGLNIARSAVNQSSVGGTMTNGMQLIYEVHAYCLAHPRMQIDEATLDTFASARDRGE